VLGADGVSLRWDVEGRDWPLRAHSRFVEAGGLRWHVQCLGEGPAILLLHGTGASTHSWRDVAPLLSDRFRLIIPDLPGHAFTQGRPPAGLSLPAIAHALAILLDKLEVTPAATAAHSAGAAIACRMALDRDLGAPIVAFAPALLPMGGSAAPLFSGLARLLFLNPLAPRLFAGLARQRGRTDRFLLRATGSQVDSVGSDLYERLFTAPGHVAGVIEMMARWDLADLVRDLPKLPAPLLVVAGENDKAVPAREAERAARLARAHFELLPRLGHLLHEEEPAVAAGLIREAAEGAR
jgi:magnesium chelatase accessory protein